MKHKELMTYPSRSCQEHEVSCFYRTPPGHDGVAGCSLGGPKHEDAQCTPSANGADKSFIYITKEQYLYLSLAHGNLDRFSIYNRFSFLDKRTKPT